MASKARLKYNGEVVYPTASLDNLVDTAIGGTTVHVPTLDASGKISSAYIPDGIGGGAAAAVTSLVDLGNTATVTVNPGGAYKLKIPANGTRTIKTNMASAGELGKETYLRIVVSSYATVKTEGPFELKTALATSRINDYIITYAPDRAQAYKKVELGLNGNLYSGTSTISSGVTVTITGERAVKYAVGSYGRLYISNGGYASVTSVAFQGYIYVSSGGTLYLNGVINGGALQADQTSNSLIILGKSASNSRTEIPKVTWSNYNGTTSTTFESSGYVYGSISGGILTLS